MDSFHFWNPGHSLFLPSLEAAAVRLKRWFSFPEFHRPPLTGHLIYPEILPQRVCPGPQPPLGQTASAALVPSTCTKLASRSSLVSLGPHLPSRCDWKPELGLATCSPRALPVLCPGRASPEHGTYSPSESFHVFVKAGSPSLVS